MLTMNIIISMKLTSQGFLPRIVLVIFIAGISFPAIAHEPEGRAKKIDFSEVKNARLEKLESLRACISKSTNFKQLRACKPKRKS